MFTKLSTSVMNRTATVLGSRARVRVSGIIETLLLLLEANVEGSAPLRLNHERDDGHERLHEEVRPQARQYAKRDPPARAQLLDVVAQPAPLVSFAKNHL